VRTVLLASLGLALIAGPAGATAQTWDQSWDVTTPADVHVVCEDAHVRVHAGPAGKVKAHVEYDLKTWGIVLGRNSPVVVFEHKSDQVWITLHDPHGVGVFGGIDERFVVDVTVPDQSQLSVRSGDGAIDCPEPLSGRFQFESGDGAIRARGLKGDVDVSCGDGRVTLDDIEGRLRARTRDGHLSAAGRFDTLDLSAGDGRVDAFVRTGSRVSAPWNVETGDGAVSLKIPHDLSALLDARTRDGHINVQLPIQIQGRIQGHDLVGELNGGGPSFRIRTGDGSITLALSD